MVAVGSGAGGSAVGSTVGSSVGDGVGVGATLMITSTWLSGVAGSITASFASEVSSVVGVSANCAQLPKGTMAVASNSQSARRITCFTTCLPFMLINQPESGCVKSALYQTWGRSQNMSTLAIAGVPVTTVGRVKPPRRSRVAGR